LLQPYSDTNVEHQQRILESVPILPDNVRFQQNLIHLFAQLPAPCGDLPRFYVSLFLSGRLFSPQTTFQPHTIFIFFL
jgi:hypothetical protein